MNPTIQAQIDEAIKYRDPVLARDVLIATAKDSQLKLPRPDYLHLNYLRMNSLDQDRVLNLIKESILAAYQIPGFDLEQKITDYFELLEYPPFQIDFVYKLKAVLDQHQEILGTQKITVNGKTASPTIANWILDYQTLSSTTSKDALGELKYINNAPNLKGLTIPQRKVLQSIIRIYDRVAQLAELWEVIPEKLPPEQIEEFRQWATKKLEEEYGTEIPEQGVSPVEVVNTQPAPKPEPLPSIIEQPSAPNPYKIPLQKDLDLSTQPKKGLVFDMPTNIDLDQEAVARKKRDEEQAQLQKIQSKLEDLKKRKI